MRSFVPSVINHSLPPTQCGNTVSHPIRYGQVKYADAPGAPNRHQRKNKARACNPRVTLQSLLWAIYRQWASDPRKAITRPDAITPALRAGASVLFFLSSFLEHVFPFRQSLFVGLDTDAFYSILRTARTTGSSRCHSTVVCPKT